MRAFSCFFLLSACSLVAASAPPMMEWQGKALIAGPTRLFPLEGRVTDAAWTASGKRLVAFIPDPMNVTEVSDLFKGRQVTPRPPQLAFISPTSGQVITRVLPEFMGCKSLELAWLPGEQYVLAVGTPLDGNVRRVVLGASGAMIPVPLDALTVYFEPHASRPEILSISINRSEGATFARWTMARGWDVLLKTSDELLTAIPDPNNSDVIYVKNPIAQSDWLMFDSVKRSLTPIGSAGVRERTKRSQPTLTTMLDRTRAKAELNGDVFALELRAENEATPPQIMSGKESQSSAAEFPRTMHLGFSFSPGWIRPDQQMVAMAVPGGLAIKPIIAADLETLRQARLAAERTASISDSKQAALAILMWIMDNDGVIPGSENHPSSFLPYSKSIDVLQKFVFTCDAKGKLNAVSDPSTVELGYVPGPGGRAVAYLDGHVRWIPDAPSK